MAKTSKRPNPAASEGGSGAALGFGFQANATAFMLSHLLSGQRLGGIDPLLDQVPISVASESGGPGDDIRLEFADGSIVEVQVKRGLSRGPRLWEALDALALGLYERTADVGVLITCPNASGPIRTHLARDLVRIGTGRIDALSDIGNTWLARLADRGIPPAVCARMRIQTLAANEVEGDAVRLAQGQLRSILADPSQADVAWTALAADAARMIEFRASRTVETALQALSARGISLRADGTATAGAALLQQLCAWVSKTNATYSIVGFPKPLPIDTSWLEQTVHVLSNSVAEPEQFVEALRLYRGQSSVEAGNQRRDVDAATIGQFVPHCIVLAGPGMGKTTLLTKLARTYAADGLPVLKVRLRALAERMRSQGCGFEEGLFALGCDSSGLSPEAVRGAGFSRWVILCDGLDECGPDRAQVASEIAAFSHAHPGYRIIVTSRTIGYQAGALTGWRHYALGALNYDKLTASINPLIDGAGQVDADNGRIATILEMSPAIKTIAASPLLLGLATALALKQGSIGQTEADLYQNIFALVETAAVARAGSPELSHTEITRAIDIIGKALVFGAAESAAQTLSNAAQRLATDFGCTVYEARRRCEVALGYWCEVGLIERIHHQGSEMLAFVHKTFGEFACARFIAGEPLGTQRQLLERAVVLQADPVADFAAALGLAELAFAVLLDDQGPWNADTVIRALALLNHARAGDVEAVVDRLLARAYSLVSSADRNDVDRIGGAMIAVISEHREAVHRAAIAALDNPSPDARIVAWTLLLEDGAALEMYADLCAFAREVSLPAQSREERSLLLGGIRGRPPVSGLLEAFAIRLGEIMLGSRDGDADALLTSLFKHPGLSSTGFIIKVEKLVEQVDRRDFFDGLRVHWYGEIKGVDFEGVGLRRRDLDEYEAATAECEIAQLGALAGDAQPDPRIAALSVLPQLSAYREITDWGDTPANDVWQWRREGWREVEREVLRAVVHVGIIDPERIAIEAASVLDKRDELRAHHSFVLFRKTAVVDVPLVDWAAARNLSLDPWKIEQALHHGSEFLLRLAVKLLNAMLADEDERCTVVTRIIVQGADDTLWGAAELAKGLRANQAVPLAIERLRRDSKRGAEYMFNVLEHHLPPLDEELEAVLRDSLTSRRPRVAISAASIIPTFGLGTTLRAALFAAIDHWNANPPEKPSIGEPPDPRREMAKTLAKVAELTDAELAGLISFREDVVRDVLTMRWREVGSFRTLLLARAEAGTLTASSLSALLETPVNFDLDQRAAAIRLALSSDPKMRRAMLKVFAWPGFLDPTTRPILQTLTQDSEEEIVAVANLLARESPESLSCGR